MPKSDIPDISEKKALKRWMRLKEVQQDVKRKLARGGEFTPSDFLRSYGLVYLFLLEYSGFISFPYDDVLEWEEFKEVFYECSSVFDEVFDFKRSRGRPTEAVTDFLQFSGVFCREHNLPI
ncbi:MAG: hypothetical protein QMC90_04690 [Dehalococcoidales bacterium]|nr:hypothetical protein [Dehalococcoidales bacterium]